MTEELGKIEKPSAERFTGKRKLLLIPLLLSGKDMPQDFVKKFDRYWNEVREQIENMEMRLGEISRIYHETVFADADAGAQVLENSTPQSYQIIQSKSVTKLQATEDRDLAQESMDWERCIMVSINEKVREKVTEFYLESSKKRYDHIAQKIDETLKEGETGILFIREEHRVQFPQDLEVFNVYPPALDEINRWLRDYSPGSTQA